MACGCVTVPVHATYGCGAPVATYALVDPQDVEWVHCRWWYLNDGGYAITRGVHGLMPDSMHRMVMHHPAGLDVDHIDRNPLHNGRHNLRAVTHWQNMRNQGPRRGQRFKGVTRDPSSGLWRCTFRGEFLGCYGSEEIAAAVYNEVAAVDDPHNYLNPVPPRPSVGIVVDL